MELYERWPRDLVDGFDRSSGVGGLEGDNIVVCGMGGSAAAADMISKALDMGGGPEVFVVKDAALPSRLRRLDNYSLVAISYSGNTAETIRCALEASRRANSVVAVSAGGRLEREASERGWVHIGLSKGHLPRTAYAQITGVLMGLLARRSLWSRSDIDNISHSMLSYAKSDRRLLVESIVDGIKGKELILVEVCREGEPLGIRFKNELEENSKLIVKLNIYPESAHNDIVPIPLYSGRIFSIMIDSGGLCSMFLEAVTRFYEKHGVDFTSLSISIAGPLKYIEDSLKLAQAIGLASVELAKLRGLDPSETQAISEYKRFIDFGRL